MVKKSKEEGVWGCRNLGGIGEGDMRGTRPREVSLYMNELFYRLWANYVCVDGLVIDI